jgi:hypothetical protein
MTGPVRKMSISVPPDVADHLDGLGRGNASAYVTQAVRDRMRLDELDAELAHQGITCTEAGLAAAGARRRQVEAEWPRERREALRARVRQHVQDDTGSQASAA